MQQRFLLQILLLAQHVSGTTMPITRSSRVLYSGRCLRYFVLWFSTCWSGVELRVMCPVCRMLADILFPNIKDDARSKSHQINIVELIDSTFIVLLCKFDIINFPYNRYMWNYIYFQLISRLS